MHSNMKKLKQYVFTVNSNAEHICVADSRFVLACTEKMSIEGQALKMILLLSFS